MTANKPDGGKFKTLKDQDKCRVVADWMLSLSEEDRVINFLTLLIEVYDHKPESDRNKKNLFTTKSINIAQILGILTYNFRSEVHEIAMKFFKNFLQSMTNLVAEVIPSITEVFNSPKFQADTGKMRAAVLGLADSPVFQGLNKTSWCDSLLQSLPQEQDIYSKVSKSPQDAYSGPPIDKPVKCLSGCPALESAPQVHQNRTVAASVGHHPRKSLSNSLESDDKGPKNGEGFIARSSDSGFNLTPCLDMVLTTKQLKDRFLDKKCLLQLRADMSLGQEEFGKDLIDRLVRAAETSCQSFSQGCGGADMRECPPPEDLVWGQIYGRRVEPEKPHRILWGLRVQKQDESEDYRVLSQDGEQYELLKVSPQIISFEWMQGGFVLCSSPQASPSPNGQLYYYEFRDLQLNVLEPKEIDLMGLENSFVSVFRGSPFPENVYTMTANGEILLLRKLSPGTNLTIDPNFVIEVNVEGFFIDSVAHFNRNSSELGLLLLYSNKDNCLYKYRADTAGSPQKFELSKLMKPEIIEHLRSQKSEQFGICAMLELWVLAQKDEIPGLGCFIEEHMKEIMA